MTVESIQSQVCQVATQCYNPLTSNFLFFKLIFFRKRVLPQINLVLKTFGDSTTDYVTEKILTQYLLKCKLVLTVNVIGKQSSFRWSDKKYNYFVVFVSTALKDWLKKHAPLFIQSEVKSKPIMARSHMFSNALTRLWFLFYDTQLKFAPAQFGYGEILWHPLENHSKSWFIILQ